MEITSEISFETERVSWMAYSFLAGNDLDVRYAVAEKAADFGPYRKERVRFSERSQYARQ